MNDDLIHLLEKKIATNELDSFLQSELGQQSPIIENNPADENNLIVTFIYQGDGDCHNANLYSSLVGNLPQPMIRLKNTNYFYYQVIVPNNIRASYAFLPNWIIHEVDRTDREKSLKLFAELWPELINDPYNPDKQILTTGEAKATINMSILEMPAAPSKIWSDQNKQTPQGSVTRHTITSKSLNSDRDYWVYLPKAYDKNTQYPLLLVFDGQLYYESGIPLPTILDNLIAENKISPVIAVLIDSVGFITRRTDLNCSETYLEFITDELLSEIHSRYLISTNRADRIVMGASLGGIFSLYAALKRSDLFGKVLSNSSGSNAIIDRLIQMNHSSKLKVYLDIGSLENPDSTKAVRDLLLANDHAVIYQEFPGAHDYACWETSIPSALMQLLND